MGKILPSFLLSLLLFAGSSSSYGQSTEWKGIVIDSLDHTPVAGASLYYDRSHGTLSQIDGTFSLVIETLPVKIKIALPGYRRKEIELRNIKPGGYDTIYLAQELLNVGQVVITASRQQQRLEEITQSAEVVSNELITNTNTNQVQEIMEKLPGVQLQKDQVTIRGGSGFSYGAGSRVMLLLDEMPLLSADASDAKWSYLPVENLEQVEVIKGPSSALYGSSAMEGIIHLRTALPADSAITQFRTYTGFYGKPARKETAYWTGMAPMKSGLTLAHRQRFGDVGITASGYRASDQGYKQGENNEISRGNLLIHFTPKKLDKWSFSASVNGMKIQGQNFLFFADTKQPFIPFPGTTSDYTNYRWHTDATIRFYPNDKSRHLLRGRYFTTINENNTGQNSTGRSLFGEYQYQRRLWVKEKRETRITSGLAYIRSGIYSDSLYGRHNGHNAAAYLQADQKLGRFNFNTGARLETNKLDTFDWYVFPVFRAGMNFRAAKGSFFRASFGQGFRYPSVAERFVQTAAGAVKLFPNPDLQPEKGWGAEAGFRQLFVRNTLNGYVDLSVFHTQYDNMIEYLFGLYLPPVYDPRDVPKYLGFAAQNIPRTRIRGAEISGGLQKKWNDFSINFYGGYTYIQPYNDTVPLDKDTLERVKYLKYRRQHLVRGNLEMSYRALSLGVYTFYNSPMTNLDEFFLDAIKNLKQDDHWRTYSEGMVTDVRLSLAITSKFSFSFFVKNVFNEEYMEMVGNTNAPRSYIFQVNAVF